MHKLTDAQRSMLEWIADNPGSMPPARQGPTRRMLRRMVQAGWLTKAIPPVITDAGRALLQQKGEGS